MSSDPLEFPEVFEAGGFDAILGNPPFMGGQKITGELGVPYREHLVGQLGRGRKGSADIVAYFFLRAIEMLKENGTFGLIATNTIAQGDTREVGLEQIIHDGHSVYHALPSMKWPGKANLEVAVAHAYKGVWGGKRFLTERDVQEITAFLDDGTASGKPFRLAENAGKSFIGSYVLGMGFVLEPEEARKLIAKNPKNADVLFPYLNGEDLNSRPDQSPSRWVINFKDWPLGRIGQSLPMSGESLLHVAETMEINLSDDWRPKTGSRWEKAETERREKWLRIGVVPSDYPGPVAADYPDCLRIIEELVRPERMKQNDKGGQQTWWRFLRIRGELHAAIADLPRVLIHPLTSKHHNLVFYQKGIVYSHMTVAFPIADCTTYAVIQSEQHWVWVLKFGNKLETRPQYTPSDCFETFPFPVLDKASELKLERIGEAYYTHRQSVCLSRNLGLTKVYNLFHDPVCHDADIAELRRLHVEMDTAVAAAYGWQDIALCHNFYGEGKEMRYTLHPDAKSEILRRLLTLNHERHAEQEAESAEIVPTLEEEMESRPRRAGNPRKAHAAAAEGQTSIDPLLLEAFLEDRQRGKRTGGTASDSSDIERAAMMATYLVMRAEAPEKLSSLRRHPAKIRLTLPREYRRTRLAKHLYFTQEVVKPKRRERQPVTSLAFTEYQRGPYTKQIESVEQEAVRRGWLKVESVWDEGRSSVSYSLGPKAEEAVKQALALLEDEEPHLDQELVPLDEEKTVRSEQWTTIHLAWKKLRDQLEREPTFTEVEAYVHEWKPDRAAFSYNAIYVTYQELKLRGLLRP